MSTLSKLISDGYTLPSNNNSTAVKSTKSTLSRVLAGDFDAPETFNKGGFLGGVGYVGARLGLGAFGILEGIWDFTAGGIAKLFGADEWAEEQFANNITGNAQADLDEWYNPSKGWQVAGDVSSGIGNSIVGMLAVAGVGEAVAASGGTLAPAVAAAISGGVIGLGAAGQSVTEAYQKTGELGGKEFAYGALSGITEFGLEYVSGAAGKVGASLFAKQTAKTVAKKSVVKGLVSNFAGEAFEEGMSEILDPYFQRWTQVDPNAENATAQEVGYAALIGGLSGVLMGGFGEAATTVKQIRLGNNIAKNSSSVSETLNYAKSFANYEAEHNTGRAVYTEISDLVSRYEAADRGDGTITVGQKKMLGQMGIDVAALVHDKGIQRSKKNIIENADSFVKGLNERGYTDAEGNPVHFASTQEFLANDAVVTRFATMDYLGQLLMSADSVYDFIVNKNGNSEILQAEFRGFQKDGSPQQKKSINELFGIDVDSITYEDFIDKMQRTSRETIESRKGVLQTRRQAKNAVLQAINTKSDVATLDGKTVFAEGMSVFKAKGGDYVAISKQGNQYFLYADNNISKPLTKAELKAVIKAINGEQTTARAKKPNAQAPQAQQGAQATSTAQTVATETTGETTQRAVETTTETAANSTVEENTSKPTTATETSVETENNGSETATQKARKKPKATETRTETAAETESITQSGDTSATAEQNPNQNRKTKAPAKTTARRGVVRLVMNKQTKDFLRGAAVKNGNQYVSDGFFVAKYNNVLEGVTDITTEKYPFDVFDRVISENASPAADERIALNGDDIRNLVPSKRAEYGENIMRIGDNYYQLAYVSKIMDSMENPQVFLKKKGDFNPIYIKGDNGEAVFFPIRVKGKGGKVKTVYEADYSVKKTEQATTQKKKPTVKAKKKTAIETTSQPATVESTTDNTTATETQKTISDKTYHDFTVKEFESLPQPMREHYIAKSKTPNAIVFAQIGDFYEAFFSDAEKAADIIGLTLTSREVKGYSDRAKMVGIPVRYFDDYSAKLKAKGFDVVKVDSDGRKVIYRAESSTETVDTAKNTTEKKPTAEKKKKATTKKTVQTTKTEDFGEKIGGARKDTWQKRGLITSDLTAMNRRELQRHVKKENVWKRPDFVKAVAEGGDRAILYAQKELYKSLNATPLVRRSVATDTTSTAFQSVMEQYVSEVRDVQKLAESIKSKEDLGEITSWLIEKGYMQETGNTYGARYAWTEKYYDSPALYKSNLFETARKLERGFDTLNETAIIEGFGTAKADRLPQGYSIRKYDSFWNNEGTKYVIVKGGKNGRYVSPYFSSYEDALAYGKKTFGTAETAAATTDGKKKRYVPEQLKDVHRTGLDYRNGNNAVGENFIHDFGIKGGEFGNWLSETDRTTSLNYGYDAFCDLADALGIEMTDISLNGTLSIGFGSRGQGLSGAAAHYESDRKVINLTKMNGAGSLAHEFWHAVEDYVSGDTHQGDMASDFSKMPEKTKAAGCALLDAINYKDRTVSIEEINENQAKALERNLRQLKKYLDTEFKIFSENMTEEQRAEKAKTYRYKRTPTDADIKRFQELKEKAMQGENGVYNKFFSGESTIVDDLSALLKDVSGRGLDKETRRSLAYYIDYTATYSKEAVETQTKRVKTKFYEDAIAISKTYAKDGGYWDSNCEMLARAFAAYINAKTDGRNDYLSGHALGAVPVVGKDGAAEIAYTYPQDTAEAETIFKAFDDFFAAAKEDGFFHEATREKPKTTTRYAMSEDTQLNTTPNGSKGQQLKPLQMKHAETVARNNIKGYEALTEAEKLEVEWTLASAWRAGKSTTEALQLAKLSTAIGAGVGFADISTKTTDGKTVAPDAACYTRGGHLTIYLNPNGKRTVECATLHELVHSMEGMEGYSELAAMAEEYYAKHPEEKAAIDNLYKDVYKNEQVKYAEEILPSELTAHYVESMLAKRDILAKITRENPTFVQKCIEKLKAIRNKLTKADKNASLSEVDMLETRFTTIFNLNKGKIANKSGVSTSVATDTAKQFSIQTDESGRQYVQADRRVILGDNPEVWKTQITKYINEVIRQGKDIKITTVEGDTLTITQNTAGKAAYQNKGLSTDRFKTKLNAEAHIDELSEISVSKKNSDGAKKITPDHDGKHAKRNLAKDGWSYRTAYFRDFDGKFYKLQLSVAIDGTVESVYNVGTITEKHLSGESRLMPQRATSVSTNSIAENSGNVNTESTNTTKKFAISQKNSDLDLIFDDKFYARYANESKATITETISELEKVKASDTFESMSFEEKFDINAKIRALKAGYKSLYDYYVGKEKERLTRDYEYSLKTGIPTYAQSLVESKKKEIAKAKQLQADIEASTPFKNAQFEIIQLTNPMFNDTSVGIRSPKDIHTFAEVVDDADSFHWGDFTREDAQNALKRGKIRVFSSYPIKNGVFVSTSYQQALDYAGGNPNGVHSRVVALDSVAWINGDEGQYAKVYSETKKRYALTPDDVAGSDRTLTELPDDRVTFRDVVTHKKKASDLTTQIKGDSREFTEGWQIATTNAQAGLERVLRETGNSEATATTNYVRAAKNAAYGALTVGQFTLDGETYVGESWQKIWQPIYTMDKKDGQAYKMFNLYLLHWHNTDRYAVGKPVFGTDVTVSDSLKAIEQIEAEYPKFRKIAEKVWRFNDNNLQLGVDSGTLSAEYAATVREMYPHYVPTLRAEHSKPLATIQGKNNVRINPNNRRAIGSDLDILPIDETVAQQTIQRISSARTNKMLLDIKNGSAHDEFVVIGAESANADIDSDNLVTTYADKAKGTHQVTFWENGKSVTAEVSQNVYRGIESFMPSGDTTFNNILMNGVAKINTTFKKLVTAWNPFFVFFKNPIRDIQTALNYTRYSWSTFAKNYKRAMSEISSNGRYWQEAQAAGILSASVYDYRKGLQYKNKGKWAQIMGKLESASNSIEMAPRLAEYISARESGLSVQESLLQAQDVTTNFGRGGTLTKKANATFMPFLNPAVQGFSKLVRAYTGKDAAKSWGNLIIRSIILGIGLTALNDLLNDDDEDYQNLSDYVKNNNYVLALGDGQFLKIPKGRENGFIGELYLRARRYASGETDAWEGTFESFVSNLTPTDNFTRTIFSPFVDISTNSTWYGGTIEGQKWNNTEPKKRYDESTSSISIWLGQVFNYSPIKIDYLLEQYLGVVADVVLPATNLEAETGVISQNMIANSTNNSRWSTQFYSQLEKYNYKKTDGDVQAKGVVKYLNNISGTVSDLYNQKRAIQSDKSLSNDEKLTQVKIIQTAINALQKESLTNAKILYEELGKYDLATDDNFDTAYLYSIATVLGEEYALKSYNKDVYAKAQSLNTLGIEYGTYFDYYFGLKQITSDKDASGATIGGSKKANVIAYTMAQDIPTVQKLILIMSAGYKISDGDISRLTAKQAKTLVVKYITKLDISREEKAKLAQMCGFTVKNGRIYITD